MPIPDGRITMEDYRSWTNNPVTREIAKARNSEIREAEEFMGGGGTVNGDSVDSTALTTATNVGYIKGLKQSLLPPLYLYETIETETSE